MKIKQAVKALSAIAHDSRLAIFRLLVKAGPEGRAAGEIAEEIGIVPATLSFHLNQLANAGLVVDRREGRSIIYSMDVEAVRDLMTYLMEDCCQGSASLCCGPTSRPRAKRKK